MVYVLDKNGTPLMPTTRHGKVRRLLKNGLAKVVNTCPFTIQLLYATTDIIQDISLGIDTGSKTIGLSATTKNKVLFEAEVTVRNNIVALLASRRELRNKRRFRKTRYRKCRFLNRIRTKKEGWLAPSIRQKIETHIVMVKKVHKILPISKIIIEVAQFDIQKIKNPDISGIEYQQGEQFRFWNVREYVLWRDNHVCQHCKGKSGDKILNVHHIESRKTGGDAPNNLITLCETCHKKLHKGKIKLKAKRGQNFKDAAFMSVMRWTFYHTLKEIYDNVNITYGYITKSKRIQYNLFKAHYIDARCISENPMASPLNHIYYFIKVRCHNRQIHKCTVNKGGYRKLNQAPYIVNGFRLFDKVLCKKQIGFISARRQNGQFRVRDILWNSLVNSITFRKLKFVNTRQYYLCDMRKTPIIKNSAAD